MPPRPPKLPPLLPHARLKHGLVEQGVRAKGKHAAEVLGKKGPPPPHKPPPKSDPAYPAHLVLAAMEGKVRPENIQQAAQRVLVDEALEPGWMVKGTTFDLDGLRHALREHATESLQQNSSDFRAASKKASLETIGAVSAVLGLGTAVLGFMQAQKGDDRAPPKLGWEMAPQAPGLRPGTEPRVAPSASAPVNEKSSSGPAREDEIGAANLAQAQEPR